jgi:ssDNA-binding Zn-finger/Zn-ribbon topoisomerase 1
MTDFIAKCPRCGTEAEVKKIYKTYRYGVEGICPNCKVHFTTSMFWEAVKEENKT